MSDFTEIIAGNVRAEMARSGYNSAGTADALGRSYPYIRSRIRAEKAWSGTDLAALATLWNIHPGMFFVGIGNTFAGGFE